MFTGLVDNCEVGHVIGVMVVVLAWSLARHLGHGSHLGLSLARHLGHDRDRVVSIAGDPDLVAHPSIPSLT